MSDVSNTPYVPPCSKCGATDIRLHYHGQGCSDPDHGDWCNKCGWGSHNQLHAEHLHYFCQVCHYDWTGPVAARARGVA